MSHVHQSVVRAEQFQTGTLVTTGPLRCLVQHASASPGGITENLAKFTLQQTLFSSLLISRAASTLKRVICFMLLGYFDMLFILVCTGAGS